MCNYVSSAVVRAAALVSNESQPIRVAVRRVVAYGRMRALCSGVKRVLQASWQAVLCEPSDAYASARRKQKALTSALGFADDD